MNPIYLDRGFLRHMGTQAKTPIEWRGCELPNGLVIGQGNYYSISAKLGVPRSLLVSLSSGTEWFSDLKNMPEDRVAFYDIETENDGRGERFLFGKVLSLRGKERRFDDPIEMSVALAHYNAAIGFNSYRFDNEILSRNAPGCFEAIDLPRFTLRVPAGTLCLDALPFYGLWRPWAPDHKMQSLGAEMGVDIPSLDDKDARCSGQLRTLREFFPHLARIHDWYVETSRISPYDLFSLPMAGFYKLRRWYLQSWYLQHGIYPELHKVESSVKPDFYRCFRRGFYRGPIYRYDIKSCYPVRAANMKLGLFSTDDFSQYMEYLAGQRQANPGISTNLKFLANATIGDMASKTSILANANILSSIWNAHRAWMQDKVRKVGKANIIFSYTDNFWSLKPLDLGDTKPYEVKQEEPFEWLCVYNQQRILALQRDGAFFRRHFDREMRQLGMWKEIDNTIETALEILPEEFLKDPLEAISIKNLIEGLPLDSLKLTVYKNSEECRDVNYYMIWDKLKMGFNECWLGKRNATLTEPNLNRIDFRRYERMAKKYIALYKLGGKNG